MQSWCHREDEAHKVCIIHLELASQPKKKTTPKTKQKNPTTSYHLKTIPIIFSDVPGCVGCTVVFHVCGKVLFLPRQAGTEERCGYVGTYADFSDFLKGVFLEASFIVHVDTVEI